MKHQFIEQNVPNSSAGLVNKPTIARRYAVSTRTVDNWISRRIIPFMKIGGVVRFRISEVDAALARFEVKN
jgi:excisionase family DNA binding protein